MAPVSRQEFAWSETDEPHRSRRSEILQKHPEMKELFGTEPKTFWITLGIFCFQVAMAYLMRDAHWGVLFLCAYAIGGTCNHSLQLAVHEISHNLCWESQWANYFTGIFGNLVTGVPSSVSFRKYHMEHHQFQGVDGIDTDVPTPAEVRIFNNTVKKVIWLFLQPFFYAVRPLMVKPKPLGKWEIINLVCCMTFNALIVNFLGYKSLVYLVAGSLLGMGLHPCAGHFIAEHYEFIKGQETYSYYGPCNYLNFNVGYHYEHHDFPRIPWSRLPRVREIAPEYYNTLPSYTSYLAVFWRYITDPTVGPASRVKRVKAKSATLASAAKATAAAG